MQRLKKIKCLRSDLNDLEKAQKANFAVVPHLKIGALQIQWILLRFEGMTLAINVLLSTYLSNQM